MRVVIAGGHGKIALILERLLSERGDSVAGLMGAELRPEDSSSARGSSGRDPVFAAYLRAKAEADAAVRARTALDATIVRPGLLTNEPGTGRVTIADSTGRGRIPREDVAAMLVALLDTPATAGQTFEVISGDTPIRNAVAARAR